MRHELSDHEWTAIKPMLPNKPRSVRRVNDRRVLNGNLDLGVCPTERGIGKHSAEAKSQRPDLLHPYLYRARNLVERFFNKSSNVGVS